MTDSPRAAETTAPPATTDKVRILVSGDFASDYNIYLPGKDCEESPADLQSRYRCMLGGSVIIYNVLDQLAAQFRTRPVNHRKVDMTVGFGGNGAMNEPTSCPAAAVWRPKPGGSLLKPDKAKVWRLENSLGLGETIGFPSPPRVHLASEDFLPDILVVEDDAGKFRFRLPPAHWPNILDSSCEGSGKPDWIVLKMTGPVCQGDLWWHLTREGGPADRLVVVLPIGDLRKEDVRISQGISWERTAEDIVRELKQSPVLAGLQRARHVVIVLNGEGAIWVDLHADEENRYQLFFDPGNMEQEWAENTSIQGTSYGFMSGFTAALTAGIAASEHWQETPDMEAAIVSSLRATRRIRLLGHGLLNHGEPEFPSDSLAQTIVDDLTETPTANSPAIIDSEKLGVFGQATIPAATPSRTASDDTLAATPGRSWRILEDSNPDGIRAHDTPLYGVARRVALFGAKEMKNIPYARFGALLTTDRNEIEALRNIKRLMHDYDDDPGLQKPLSLGVFGPPGAGKSFAIKQIAAGVLGEKNPCLEFNLSQFDDTSDLIGAFHQVRDQVLKGHTPVVFWDEFDSGGYKWLQYLLAPMQDGKFQEDQITHPIGRCIFVFAGATSYDFENFGPCRDDEKVRFELLKGPDFKSRLHGFLNVLGPNRRQVCHRQKGLETREWKDDPMDVCFPVRRAVFLRAQFGLVKDRANERMKIDHGLLAALLEIDCYENGARSMEKIVQSIRHADTCHARRSGLPTDEVLAMNTDAKKFMRIAVGSQDFQAEAEKIAPHIHEFYRDLCKRNRWDFRYDMDYGLLPEPVKMDNIAAAHRIPWVLSLAGLYLTEGPPDPSQANSIDQIIKEHLGVLAQEEHDLWMRYKLKNGWKCVEKEEERDDDLKLHHCLRPFDELAEKDKVKDCDSVTNYPTITTLAGFQIVAERPRSAT